MPTEAELLRLSLMAYEATAEPEVWPVFMKRFTETISADSSVFQIHDLGSRASAILHQFGLDSPLTQAYNEYYSKRNIWRDRSHALYSPGRINLDQEQCPRPLLEASEFYNDYLLRINAAYSMGAVIARKANLAPTLSALGSLRRGPFGEEERQVVRLVLPHMSRAWTLQEHRELFTAQESVLDALPVGIVLFRPGGLVLYCNHAAERMICANDGLELKGGRLRAIDRDADALLGHALNHAFSPRQPPGPATVSVPRPSFRRAYQVVTAPLRGRTRALRGTAPAAAVAFVKDPEQNAPTDSELLIRLYKLTRKEAALAAKLSEGKSVEQAAEDLSMTYETARTHLRRVFRKTETTRQAELLLLMARLPTIAAET